MSWTNKPPRSLPGAKSYIKKHNIFILFIIIFLLGILAGVLCARDTSSWTHNWIAEYSNQYMHSRNGTFVQIFIHSITSALPVFILLLCLGFSAISAPAIFCMPFFMGLSYGCLSGYICLSKGVSGIAYIAVLMLPHAILSAFFMILYAKECLRLSLLFFNTVKNSGNQTVHTQLRLFFSRSGVYFLLLIVASIIDAALSAVFANLFTF